MELFTFLYFCKSLSFLSHRRPLDFHVYFCSESIILIQIYENEKAHTYVGVVFLITFSDNYVSCFFFLIYFWLCWVFVSVRGLSLVVASGGHSSSRCAGLSLPWPLLLQSTSSRRAGSVVVAHGPSCSAACGILPDQGSNPCALH